MNKKIFSILIFLMIFLFTGLSLPSCGKEEETETAEVVEEVVETPVVTLNEEPLATVDATSYDASITKNFEDANKEAKKWNKDAKLVMVSVKLPADLSLDASTQTYTYGASEHPNYWWTYSLAEQTQKFVRALVYKDDYLGTSLDPIPIKYWRTNYIEVFQIAENYQGKEFRINHQNVNITLTLSVGEPNGFLWWLVEYKTPEGESYSVRINPNDRTIVDETGKTIEKGTTYSPEEAVTETGTTPSATISPATETITETEEEYYFVE